MAIGPTQVNIGLKASKILETDETDIRISFLRI